MENQNHDNANYSSDSDSNVEVRPAMLANDEPAVLAADDGELEPQFWMATRQTQCGANHTERMVSFLKQVTQAQVEFADKLAAISTAELSRAKHGSDDSAVYQEYWAQLQAAMRLCRTWSTSTKEMTQAIGHLIAPMDRIVHVGRARLKESAHWNVELNKALSEFHTNVAKRQAKCYKALSVVMTPEYFDQSPARKSHAVRRAAPTVSKYVEQIDEANSWLAKYMAQRPILKNRLETLEQKRIEVTRGALTTFASQISSMGKTLTTSADDIVSGIQSIDDLACKRTFITECRNMPMPHLESPAMFAYTLPVPLSELGIRGVRDPRVRQVHARTDSELSSDAASAAPTPRQNVRTDSADSNQIGKRFAVFANRVFGQQGQKEETPRRVPNHVVERDEYDEEEDNMDAVDEITDMIAEVNGPEENSTTMDRQQVTRFGNIRIENSGTPKVMTRPAMKVSRRGGVATTIDSFDAASTA